MPVSILIHISGEEPILADVDEMPDINAQAIACSNMRRRDGKEIHYLDREATHFFIPWRQISLVEVLTAEEEAEIISFVRE
jgi:hypothetical protein